MFKSVQIKIILIVIILAVVMFVVPRIYIYEYVIINGTKCRGIRTSNI